MLVKGVAILIPDILNHLERVRLLLQCDRLGLLVDFDGTISRIAPTPDEAEVSRRAAESLRSLAIKLDLVSVISGRSARDVAKMVAVDGVVYVGNHGAEYLAGGDLTVATEVVRHREAIRRILDHLESAVSAPGLVWDDKQFSASVHFRLVDDPDHVRRLLEAALESAPTADEVEVYFGKMVLEIVPPAGVDKGYALRRLVREWRLDAALFLGDDTTDVAALAALRDLRARGELRGAGVAVLYQDSPEELARVADYALDGVTQVEVFLEWLDSSVG